MNYQIFSLYEKIVKKKPIVIKLFYQKYVLSQRFVL
jgi:hypothetical protein